MESLIRGAESGDREAFEALYRQMLRSNDWGPAEALPERLKRESFRRYHEALVEPIPFEGKLDDNRGIWSRMLFVDRDMEVVAVWPATMVYGYTAPHLG